MEIQSGKMNTKPAHDVALAEQVIKTMEQVVDDKIEEIDSMNNLELEKLREERIKSMKREAAKTNELLSRGHGGYEDVEEKLFFKVSTESDKVIAHFYAGNLPICDVYHMFLKELAKSHLESRFIRVNAEKSPFLVSRLNINHFPTIVVIIDGVTADRITPAGKSDSCENKDRWTKEALEWRLSLRGGIKYDGDFDPTLELKTRRTKFEKIHKKKTIRETEDSSSDDD
uniref:Thioredoxin domain-containing protein 9 n=2 Tax=Lygus hesperus TaxID=30085 RepID=A0A0A9YIT5_LYGHE